MNSNSYITTRKRLLIAVISITFLFCFLIGRLWYLQIAMGDQLQAKGAEQWQRDLPLKAKRGAILDRTGEVIVDSKDVFTIYVRPRAVKDKRIVASVLAGALDLDESKLNEFVSLGISKGTSAFDVLENAEIVMLGVKPQFYADILTNST